MSSSSNESLSRATSEAVSLNDRAIKETNDGTGTRDRLEDVIETNSEY